MDIIPSKQDESKFKNLVDEFLTQLKVKDAKPVLGGSGAKGTWLKNIHDIDIYIRFDYQKYKDKSNEISRVLEKSLKKFKFTKLHGSRDYFQINYKNHIFELVPILDIKKPEQAKNITDISILHVNYIKKHKNLVNDMRMAKAFAKACECYGAESYIKGFSGYVLESLIINYGSFKNLIKNAAKWKELEIIGNKKVAEELSYSKKQSPLILIDPVQPDRNAAAALSMEKFERFKKFAKSYLKNPSDKFFIRSKPIIPKEAIILEVTPLKGKEDIVGSKLLKSFEYLKLRLIQEEFKIKTSNWDWEDSKAYFWFIISENPSEYKKHYGPPLDLKEHVSIFKKKYPDAKVEKNRLYVILKRKYIQPEGFINSLLDEEYIKERVKEIKIKV